MAICSTSFRTWGHRIVAASAMVFRSVLPEAVDWEPFPAFPPSVRLAVIVGQPSEPGPYVIRVKVPGGVKLMPHRHQEDRIYTVLSGIFYIGLGNSLRNRVTTHKRRVHRLLSREKKVGDTNLKTEWPRYEYAAHHNAMVAAFPVRLLGGQTIREDESEAIGLFAACFGSPPVANAAASRKTLQRRPAVPLGAFDGSDWFEKSEA